MLEHGIYDKPRLRKTVEGILYRMRTGLPWRDLPSFFGVWISIYQQFNRWISDPIVFFYKFYPFDKAKF